LARAASVRATTIDGLTLIERRPYADDRGALDRLFDDDEIGRLLPGFRTSQVNHSVTRRRGTVRGMHYQTPPNADAKVITCLRGRVFDVAVDVRHGSETFLRWHAEVLEPGKYRSFVIPEGFAHGYYVLSEIAEVYYKCSNIYYPEYEKGIIWNDSNIKIKWPANNPQLSDKDNSLPSLANFNNN